MNEDKAETQKYEICSNCEHFGTVFSYKRIAHEMMCGYGQVHCREPIFGSNRPTGFIPRKLK